MSIDLFLNHNSKEVFRISEKIQSMNKKEYEIGERIDSGGNAVIHKCVDRTEGQEYAIKFQLSLSQKRIQRFQREIELLRKVSHEQLMSYVDDGVVDAILKKAKKTLYFLVMPLADSNLKQLLKGNRGLILYEEYIGQFKGLARALSVLHQEAIHRDIKPENILIKGETWLLSDFGLCRFNDGTDDLTGVNEPLGPRYWMSPEAVNKAIGNDDEVSKISDVFQLCSVFWFVVTGRHPSGCISVRDWSGPKNLFNAIYPALSHNRRDRPSDGRELSELLDKVTLPSTTTIPSGLLEQGKTR